MADDVPLTRMEKLALKLGEWSNEDPRGKWVQNHWLRGVSYVWVRAIVADRIFVDGLEGLMTLRPEKGLMLGCFMGPVPWAKHLYFPVRSNFFYDHPLGMVVNHGIAGGAMYPPIFRQAERRALNDEALDKMVEIVQHRGNVLGMHPEGTRGKGDDPYTFLPAQPGVGKLALVGKPMVIPAFVLGLSNNLAADVRLNFTKEGRRKHPVITVFGTPLDYSDLMAEKPRPTLYKKTADRFMAEIKKLGEREKQIRADIASGAIALDDPRWINDRGAPRLYAKEGQL
jgi:1-acyl-sn-glycerol-3-phosphate acyltransferase